MRKQVGGRGSRLSAEGLTDGRIVALGLIQYYVGDPAEPAEEPFEAFSARTALIPRNVFESVGPFEPGMDLGEDVDWFLVEFAVDEVARPYLGADWPFPEEHGTWTTGREAVIRLQLDGGATSATPLALAFRLAPHLSPMRPHLQVDVVVNHRQLVRWSFVGTTWSPQDRKVVVDPSLLDPSGRMEIRLIIRRLTSPNSVDGGSDSRHLGLYLSALAVRAAGPAGAPRRTGEGGPLLSAAPTGSAH